MTPKKEIFLLPYAHLDTQWRWEYPTTIKKYIKNTIDANLALFEKYPDHQFNFAGAIRYAMMKEYYPESFEKVKRFIAENRWHFAGTCLDETDPLTPSVESLIRNILYGDRWAKSEFGKSSRDYLVPDCFGFPANMPTILTHCGIQGFSTQKLTWGSAVGIPFEIGIWKGPDGSELLSALNPGSYAARLTQLIQNDPGRLQRLEVLGKKNNIWKSFQYYGTGDIGGAPHEISVQQATASIQLSQQPDADLLIKQGSPDDFYGSITTQERQQMDRYTGDFLLTNHSAGTLTSAAIMKRWNRMNEQLAFAAEVAAVTAWLTVGLIYPDDKIKSAWYRTIGNQMHDILPGTSTPLAYEYSHNDEVVALNTWTSILHDSATAIAPFVAGKGDILLFNPLGEARMDAVDLELSSEDKLDSDNMVIVDAEGNSYPGQLRTTGLDNHQLTFFPKLKPFSWARFSRSQSPASVNISHPVSLTTYDVIYLLENTIYRVTISQDGTISSIFQKSLQKELLKAPLAYELQKERPMQYPSWNMDWKDRKKPPFRRITGDGKVSILENGPLHCTVQITTKIGRSCLVKEIHLSYNSPIVEFTERIHWRGKGCSLKLAVTGNMEQPVATFNWQTSRMQRGVNNEKTFEIPSRYWADLSGPTWGISLIEDSKYGYDRPHEDTLRMTLLYTPGVWYFTGFLDQKWHDWGDHTIRYALYGHVGDFTSADRLAQAFNQPVRVFRITQDAPITDKKSCALFELSDPQIGVLAVKKAEDQDGIVVRLYERYGKVGHANLIFSSMIQKVTTINGIEEPIELPEKITPTGNQFPVTLEPNQIRAYLVQLSDQPKGDLTPYKHEAVTLPYNERLIGPKADPHALFPQALIPPILPAGAITYQLIPDASSNTVQCDCQQISIPVHYSTLLLLIGATTDCETQFQWLNSAGKVVHSDVCHVAAMTGFRGQWDRRRWLLPPIHHRRYMRDYAWLNWCIGVKPGYIKRDRIEWYATHTQKDGEDQPYCYGYLQTITLPIPPGSTKLWLPVDKRIHLFAITAFSPPVTVQTAHVLRDKYDF